MAAKRQLPILKQALAPMAGTVPPPDEERPPWHWSAIGAVLVFTTWLPLAMVGQWVSSRLLRALVPATTPEQMQAWLAQATAWERAGVGVASVGPPLVGFALACFAGGALVGRFGGKAGAKEAAVGGLVAASTAWALAAVSAGLGVTWWIWPPLAGLGAGLGYVGGRWGQARRG